MKLLSVIIPSFNVQKYLRRCLDSLLYDSSIERYLDIIVVNDGSQDNTMQIAKSYQKEHECVRVIDKPNGGHGSTVNAGLNVAQGKYIKVIDADDWVNFYDFPRFVRALKDTDADIVVTNYRQEFLYQTRSELLRFCSADTSITKIDEAARSIHEPNFFFKFSMHSMAIKVEALKACWQDGLLEHTFYVDQQFVALALASAQTYQLLDYDIYRYFIGRPDQSMTPESLYRHRHDHERVLKWLLQFMDEKANQGKPYLQAILAQQTSLMLKTHYAIYLTPGRSRTATQELVKFDAFLRKNYPTLKRPRLSSILMRMPFYRRRRQS